MVLMVGKYNVSCEGKSYDNDGTEYDLINIYEFDHMNLPVKGSHKTYYIQPTSCLGKLIQSEEDVEQILRHPTNSKLVLERTLAIKQI